MSNELTSVMMNPAPQANKPSGVILYGGAFDPVHRAHIEVARAALRYASLAKVVFIPSAQSPLKVHGPVASDADRLEMLRLATAAEPDFLIDDCELRRGGISYTVDTVRAFLAQQAEAELYWIIGGDQLAQLAQWHAIGELAQWVTFLVLARPGYPLADPGIDGLRWLRIEAPLMPESSSRIRQRIRRQLPVSELLAPSVEAFIQAKRLYVAP